MVDQAARRRPPRGDRHQQGRRGKLGPQMPLQGPTDDPPAERVEQHRQEGKILGEPHIGDVGDPQLIEAGRHQPARQVRNQPPFVTRIRRQRHERTLAQAQQIVPPHQPQHAFAVHHQPVAAQLRRDPPIAITPVRQRHALDRIAHRGLLLARCRRLPMAVVAGPGDPRQGTHPLDRELALRPGRRHRRDDRVDAGAPGPSLGRRAPRLAARLAEKNRVQPAAGRSCAPARRCARAPRQIPRRLEIEHPKPLARPTCRPQRFGATQAKVLAPLVQIPARDLELACQRRHALPGQHVLTAASLNSRLNTRRSPSDIVLSSKHPLFFCLTFGVHSSISQPHKSLCRRAFAHVAPCSPPSITGKNREITGFRHCGTAPSTGAAHPSAAMRFTSQSLRTVQT